MIDQPTPTAGVLVGVDDHPATLRAVRWVAREVAHRHLPLDLIQVLPSQHTRDELDSPRAAPAEGSAAGAAVRGPLHRGSWTVWAS